MSVARDAVAIAVTGPFGSGCTTAADILEVNGYRHLRLSDEIKAEWALRTADPPMRGDLQRLGNELREQSRDPAYLVRRALRELDEDKGGEIHRVVVDTVRNLGEIEALKARFGLNFYAVAIDSPASERWSRLRLVYEQASLTVEDFREDNDADRNQETVWGQQVQHCVDRADAFIDNGEDVDRDEFRDKVLDIVSVLTGDRPRYATPLEMLMNMAYSSSHASKCLKRQVGAVVVAEEPAVMGQAVGIGYNENPDGTSPCVEEPQYGADPEKDVPGRCYRDIVRQESFVKLELIQARCPACGDPIGGPFDEVPPWRCSSCGVDLEDFFWPERAMSLCTAVHAEVRAVLAAGARSRGATLYTTTFPCFQCAEKILQAGIKNLVYTEPYPDIRAAERLQIGDVGVLRFEGVRSGRFDEIFARARPYIAEVKQARPEG